MDSKTNFMWINFFLVCQFVSAVFCDNGSCPDFECGAGLTLQMSVSWLVLLFRFHLFTPWQPTALYFNSGVKINQCMDTDKDNLHTQQVTNYT